MRTKEILLLLFIVLILASCASSKNTANQDGASDSTEVYVFDAVDSDSTSGNMNEAMAEDSTQQQPVALETPVTVEFFIVQVGAFTTEDRAKRFVEENKSKIEQELTYHYSEKVKLYVVQLPPFRTRQKAEEVRNQLWNIPAFKDSFIVPE